MKTFCITGKLKDKSGNFLERDEAIYLIENNCPDMKFVSVVSVTTSYLIVAQIQNTDKKTVKSLNLVSNQGIKNEDFYAIDFHISTKLLHCC